MSTYGDGSGAAGGPLDRPHGQQPAPAYGQPPSYGQQPQQYGQQPSYGLQAQPYGQQPAHGQYGQVAYGQYGGAPARPGGVVTAAVLGFIWGALGALVTISLFLGGAFFGGNSDEADSALPGLGDAFDAAAGVFVFLGVLALAWTVVMIWGSVRALSGRSRVLLIVGGSIAIAATGLMFIGGLGAVSDEGAGGLVLGLIGLTVSILIVVLLCTRQAAAWFAAQRARRPR